MKKLKAVLLALVALGVGAFVLVEPVPFTPSCFDPDRDLRAFCHRQMAVVKTQMLIGSLQTMDPMVLYKNRDRIVLEFDHALKSGAIPDEVGIGSSQLRSMIDEIVRERLGEFI